MKDEDPELVSVQAPLFSRLYWLKEKAKTEIAGEAESVLDVLSGT